MLNVKNDESKKKQREQQSSVNLLDENINPQNYESNHSTLASSTKIENICSLLKS